MILKDIKTDKDLIGIIDELKFRLKSAIPYSEMQKDFNQLLNNFINKHNLNNDPHSFAKLDGENKNG